jgi:CRP/FNR family transcriptional regulator, cyclic AMP receptor protein
MAHEFIQGPAPDWWHELGDIRSVRDYAPGAQLFVQGHPACGVYFVESGRVRVLVPAGAGQHELDIAGPGAVLGLSETVSHGIYKVTAEADDRVRVSFIARRDFARFLQEHEKVCLRVVELLSAELHGLYSKFVILSRTLHAPTDDETRISSDQ